MESDHEIMVHLAQKTVNGRIGWHLECTLATFDGLCMGHGSRRQAIATLEECNHLRQVNGMRPFRLIKKWYD